MSEHERVRVVQDDPGFLEGLKKAGIINANVTLDQIKRHARSSAAELRDIHTELVIAYKTGKYGLIIND